MIETIENIPVEINLLNYVNVTGWKVENGKAIHSKCSAGFIYSRGVNLIQATYDVSYIIESVSGGSVDVFFGGNLIASRTTSGSFSHRVESLVSEIKMFSGIGVESVISNFKYKRVAEQEAPSELITMAFAEPIDKWTSFYAFNPDYGFSLKRNLFTLKDGSLWRHDVSCPRNSFYGVVYDTVIDIPINQALNVIKNLKSVEIQSDKLMITTEDGIRTSLGQVSDLYSEDFRRDVLSDGVFSVDVYDREGVFFANFLRDKNTGIIEGDRLKGDTMSIKLTTTNDKNFNLFSVYVNYDASMAGI